jgi:4-hydroxy-tetrahydrodipicolinate synthase
MLITPYYNKPGDAGQLLHYTTIANKVDIPIILYNVPSRTGINMKPSIVAELAKIDNIVGIKEASGNPAQTAEIIELTRDNKKPFTVLSGDDNLTIPIMSYGGKGVVSVAANILPRDMSQMINYYLKGDQKKTLDVFYRLAPILRGLFIETNPIPVKAAANMMGLAAGSLRAPLTPLAPENQKKLQIMLEKAGAMSKKKVAIKAKVKARK